MENNSAPKELDPFVIAIREGMRNKGWNNTILAREAGRLRDDGGFKGKPYSQQAITPLLKNGNGGIVLKTNVAVAVGFRSWHAAYERGKEILQNQGQDSEDKKVDLKPASFSDILSQVLYKLMVIERDIQFLKNKASSSDRRQIVGIGPNGIERRAGDDRRGRTKGDNGDSV